MSLELLCFESFLDYSLNRFVQRGYKSQKSLLNKIDGVSSLPPLLVNNQGKSPSSLADKNSLRSLPLLK